MKNNRLLIVACAVMTALSGCNVGPDYKRPDAPMAEAFKPTPDWKIAEPVDDVAKGEWWKIYRDPVLDRLMAEVAALKVPLLAEVGMGPNWEKAH